MLTPRTEQGGSQSGTALRYAVHRTSEISAIMSLDPTGKGRKRWITRWKAALNAFAITFEGRLTPTTR